MSSLKNIEEGPPEYQSHEEEEGSIIGEEQKRGGFLGCICDNLFMILILAGVLAGFALGFGLKVVNPSDEAILWIVIAGLDPKEQGTSSLIIMAYIIIFNALGAAIGCILSVVIVPGKTGKYFDL
ncbi:unnamed protein product [Dibothriocephalus latus]|uniref:Amino acid transporter n=1 Tax=Dibothriocephalus latus TaxID=60516 RepID=A0A3P7LKX8_DIBLA|nr:unnamed protein product [Dibothriocephalus latus]